MKINDRPIGVFDSGIGGLTVFREIEKLLPHEHLLYVGDTARVPYGTKSAETVRRYSLQITQFLKKKNIKMLIAACNTASAYSVPMLQRTCSFPVSGVIVAGVQAALQKTRNGRIAVIGTEGTINSNSYKKVLLNRTFNLNNYSKHPHYFGQACPLFVPLVEEGWTEGPIVERIVHQYLRFVKKEHCDTLILGCTHYPLLKPVIQKEVGTRVSVVDSAEETARIVEHVLASKQMQRIKKQKGLREFWVSDSPRKFRQIGEMFLKQKIGRIRLVRFD